MTSPAPLADIERGYARQDPTGWWSALELEEVPQLRWPLDIPVYRRMVTDSQVKAALKAVTSPILRTRWYIDGDGCDPQVTRHVADDFGLPARGAEDLRPLRTRDRFSWIEHLSHALLMLNYGHQFFQPLFRPPGDTDDLWHLRKLAARPAWTISKINVARDGGLVGIEQHPGRGDSKPIPIPVDELVAYVYDREPGSWRGTSLLRSIYKHVMLKDPGLRIWLQSIQRNGMGQPYYTAGEHEDTIDRGLAMATSWQVGAQSGAAGPHGSKMQLLGVEGSLPNIREFAEWNDRAIMKGILANFLNLDAQGGSYALASVQEQTFTQSLQGIGQQVADVTTAHVIERLVDANWGPAEPAPRLAFEEIGSRQAATAQAIKLLTDAGVLFPDRRLEEDVRQKLGLPAKQPPKTGDVDV